MKKFYSLTIAAIMAALFGLSAQAVPLDFEAVAGLNFSTVNRDGINFRPGVHVGARATLPIPDVTLGFYVNAATLLSYRGFKADSISFNPVFLDIPIHAGYKYELDSRAAMFIEAGPYVGIGLFGKSEGHKVFSDEVGYRRLDIGMGVRGGIEILYRYSISLGGDFGFRGVTNDFSAKPRNITVSLGCKF